MVTHNGGRWALLSPELFDLTTLEALDDMIAAGRRWINAPQSCGYCPSPSSIWITRSNATTIRKPATKRLV